MAEPPPSKVFTWHGLKFNLPEGRLWAFVLSNPAQMWDFLRLSNGPMPPKVYTEIKSFLTHVYLIYLHEAQLVYRITPNEVKARKQQWRSASWSAIEKLSSGGTRPITGSIAKEIKKPTESQKGAQVVFSNLKAVVGSSAKDVNKPAELQRKIPQFLLPSSNLTLGCSKDQQHNVPNTLDLTENNQPLRGQTSHKSSSDSPTALSTTTRNLSLLDISTSSTAQTVPNPGLMKLGIAERFTNEIVNTYQDSKKRTSVIFDEKSQKPSKKSKVEVKNTPRVRLPTHPYNLRSSTSLPAAASLTRKSTTDGLANSRKERKRGKHQPCKPLDYSLIKPVDHSLKIQQETFSIAKDEMKSQRVNAMSSLKELVTEEGATFWLNYNLGPVLERSSPAIPSGARTLNAVEQTLPYLHSLKTRLVSLLHIAKDMHDARLGDWLEEEIGRAINDTAIAWNRLKLVTEDHGTKDQDMKVDVATHGDVMEQAVQDENVVDCNKGIQECRDADMEEGEVLEQDIEVFDGFGNVHGLMNAGERT